MGYPDFASAEIYKSRSLETQVRAAVGLDYPVFSGSFSDTFPGAALDSAKWFSFIPSWGVVTVAGSQVVLSTTVGGHISPAFLQSRHNLAFPLRRDTDWTFEARIAFPLIDGFGNFFRVCGRSFRDAEAIFAVKANTASGVTVNMPDGFAAEITQFSPADGNYRRYRIVYDASAQTYTLTIDSNDDGLYETGPFTIAVAGRYADAIVIGNSTAIQGDLGGWTEIAVDYVTVTGTAEAVEDPEWAAPFTYDGTRFTYLPTVLSGRVACDKGNAIDGAELELDNFSLDEQLLDYPQTYTWMRFLNRRGFIEGRAGDGNGGWTPWEVLFDGLCGEKQVQLEGGRCKLTVPMRDRYRAVADDMEIMACYSDGATAIDGVNMNFTVAQIIADIFQVKCGLAPAAMNILATPNNTPRTYNVFRQSALDASNTLAEHAALAVYQDRATGIIQVQEWPWGSDTPGYRMSTAEELTFVEWTESAFDVTSAEQLSFENTETTSVSYTATWPPHSEPWYGRKVHSNSVAAQGGADLVNRPVSALRWWARNRNLGGVQLRARGQFWVEHDLEIEFLDDRFLGFGRGETWIVDGWEHRWSGQDAAETTIRLINPHPDRFLRQNLMT